MEIKSETYLVSASTLNVRQQPSKKSSIVFKLNKGDIVESNEHGDWVKINFNGKTGYVFKKYLTVQKREEKDREKSFLFRFFEDLNFWKISFIGMLLFCVTFSLIHISNDNLDEVYACKLFFIPLFVFWIIGHFIFKRPFLGLYVGAIIATSFLIVEVLDNIEKWKHPENFHFGRFSYESDVENTWEAPSSDNYYTPEPSYSFSYDDDDNYDNNSSNDKNEDNYENERPYRHVDIFRSAHGDAYYVDENGNFHWLNDEPNGYREIGGDECFDENGFSKGLK